MPRKPKTDKQMATEKAINKNYTYAEIIDVISLDVVHSLNSDAAIKILTNDINIIQELMTRDTKNTDNNLKCLYTLHALMLPLALESVNRQDVLRDMIEWNRKTLGLLIADALKQPKPDAKLLKRAIEKRSAEPNSVVKEYMIKSANIIQDILPYWDEIKQELSNWADAINNYQATHDSNESSHDESKNEHIITSQPNHNDTDENEPIITNEYLDANWARINNKFVQSLGYPNKQAFFDDKKNLLKRFKDTDVAIKVRSWFINKYKKTSKSSTSFMNTDHLQEYLQFLRLVPATKGKQQERSRKTATAQWVPVDDKLAQKFGCETKEKFLSKKNNLIHRISHKDKQKADEIHSWFKIKFIGIGKGQISYFDMDHFDDLKKAFLPLPPKIHHMPENWKLVDDKLAQKFGYETKADFLRKKDRLVEHLKTTDKQKSDEIRSWFQAKSIGNGGGMVTFFNMDHVDDLKEAFLPLPSKIQQLPENWKPVDDKLAQEFGCETKEKFLSKKNHLIHRISLQDKQKADKIRSWFQTKHTEGIGMGGGSFSYFDMDHFDELKKAFLPLPSKIQQLPDNWKLVDDKLAQKFGCETKEKFLSKKNNLIYRISLQDKQKADKIRSWFQTKHTEGIGMGSGSFPYFDMDHFEELKVLLQQKPGAMPKVETVVEQRPATTKQNLTDAKALEAFTTALSKANNKLAKKQVALDQAQAEFNVAKEKLEKAQQAADAAKAERDVAKRNLDKAKELAKQWAELLNNNQR